MGKGSRAVLFVGGAGLIAAWLAAAADRQAVTTAAPPPDDASALANAERLVQEIQSQTTRLRAHLASAPEPSPSGRNPFSFQERAVRAPHRGVVHAASLDASPAVSVPEPPPLTLSGIAEDPAAEHSAPVVRTAVISGYGEVFLVKAGETIASRYQVTAIGADAVEIKDLITGRTIGLGLR